VTRGLSLTLKIFLGTALVVVVVLGLTLAVTSRSANRAADAAVDRVLVAGRDAISIRLRSMGQSLRSSVSVFASNPRFRAPVENRQLGDVLDQAVVAQEETGVAWVQVVDAVGMRMAKSDEPGAEQVDLAGSPTVRAALEGDTLDAFGVSGDTMLVQVAALPIEGGGEGTIIGALMVAKGLDAALADDIKQQAATQVEVAFYMLDTAGAPTLYASTLDEDALAALAGAIPVAADSAAADQRREVDLDGVHYVALGDVLRSAGGTPLGGFVLLKDRDVEFAAFNELQRTILYGGALGLVFAALFSLLVARWVTRPVAKLVEATRRATDGDYAAEITATSRDEIGTLANAFRALLADLRQKQELVEFLSSAEQARTVQLRALSDTSGQRLAEQGIEPGKRFAIRYDIKDVIGQGGMGMVFRAVDGELNETIAIKTLRKEFLSQDATALERFKGEIKLARRIAHRNVVRTYDLGEHSGVYFITMEYVEGKSLKELIRAHGRLPVNVTLSVGKQLARALEVAHEQGIIHRDIKPQNMVVGPDGVLKVMDFGIARLAARPAESGVTQAGAVIGTPEYMAPEQLSGTDMDARVDIYAAGCVLYECLTGKPPLTADTPYQLVARLLEDVPARVRTLNSEVPAALDALVSAMLEKDPARRPPSALEVHDRLAAIG
jgi:HAMP domain-containing protein/predicted Ser/Thr protein kinase